MKTKAKIHEAARIIESVVKDLRRLSNALDVIFGSNRHALHQEVDGLEETSIKLRRLATSEDKA